MKDCDETRECPYDFILTGGCDCCKYMELEYHVVCCDKILKRDEVWWREELNGYICKDCLTNNQRDERQD